MRLAISLVTAAVTTALLASSALAYSPKGPDRHAQRVVRVAAGPAVYEIGADELRDLLAAVQQLEQTQDQLRGPRHLIKRLRKQTQRLRSKLRRVHHVAVPVVTGPVPMAESRFEQVRKLVKQTSFSSEMLATLKASVAHSHFTVNQIERILPLFSFERLKLDVVRLMAPRVIDPENLFRLQSQFNFSSSRSKLRQIISG